MPKISYQTKTFTLLFVIALIACGFSVYYNKLQQEKKEAAALRINPLEAKPENPSAAPAPAPEIKVDTSDWKDYADKTFNFSFKYNPAWKVNSVKKQDGYYVLSVDPGRKYYNINVYVSKNSYYAVDGVPMQDAKIDGQPAKAIPGLLYAVSKDGNFFTFDVGNSLSLTPQFKAMVESVKFE